MSGRVRVIGAGLAGCEAAFQLAERGITVSLVEMKPLRRSPAHKSDSLCELVCSNSLRSDRVENAAGLLKAELRKLGSLVMDCADKTAVPAGGALAVDREGFSAMVTERIRSHPMIELITEEVCDIPDGPAIIATGPLTDGPMLDSIEALMGGGLHFYDAAAPIVTCESINMDRAFRASRYERGSDYINCPMTREEYFAFIRALTAAETAQLHEFETPKVFEGCMPVEIMARRGDMTLAFGPLKPVGLIDERTGRRPFAVVQLRQDDAEGRLFNIVGFQTNLKFAEQRRVFGMIPGLENAEFARYGVMHRNTFTASPGRLDKFYGVIKRPGLYFAGQITGVEGYIESAASGFVAGVSLARETLGMERADFTRQTAVGALAHYVSGYNGGDFQPMNINFGIMEQVPNAPKNKRERYALAAERANSVIDGLIKNKL